MSTGQVMHEVETSTGTRTSPPVVVGLLGDSGSRAALDWALEEAMALGAPLHLVHARTVALPGAEIDVWGLQGGEDVLADAATRVGGRVETTSACVDGSAVRTLVTESAHAALVVLGPPTHGQVGSAVMGSTAVEVAARAHCPVVVVRGEGRARSGRRVVVGFDGTEAGVGILEVAFDRARRLGLPLTVVHVWPIPAAGVEYPAPEVALEIERRAREDRDHSARAVAEVGARYPDVTVSHEVLRSVPGRVLVDASRSAELVVVGSRGRNELTGLVLGSVGQTLMRRAACPVMIVPREVETSHG